MPFFVLCFLSTLQDKELIWLSMDSYKWEWDLEGIRLETKVLMNVVKLLINSMERLPMDTQTVLVVVAACMGSKIQVDVLKGIIDFYQPAWQGEGD
jgi:predicted ATPase